MAIDLKKLSFGQLTAICGGLFITVMIIAGGIIAASAKPPQKVVTKREAAQFNDPVQDIELQRLKTEIKQLKEQIEQNAKASQVAFSQAAEAIDQQARSIQTLDTNIQLTITRIASIEKAKMTAKVNIIKPEDQKTPTRTERLVIAADNKSTTSLSQNTLATVGGRAWIRSGEEEISVKEGEVIPIHGNLVVKQINPSGQVSVSVETGRAR